MSQQNNTSTSMHAFLYKNADSTIIYHFQPSFLEAPKYFIVSKKGDTISIYTYGSTFSRNKFKEFPKSIRDTLKKIHFSKYLNSYKVGINEFFDIKTISKEDAKTFWDALLKLEPWQIKDDKHNGGGGCPPNNNQKMKNYTTDNGGINIDLITANEIINLYFDDPWYYESKDGCPGNTNRLKVLKIEKLFKKYFRD